MTGKNNRARVIRYAIAAAVVVVLVAVAMRPSSQLVDSATVDRGPVRATVDAEGRTRVRDRYVIAAPIAATARRLTLEPGDPVKAGQTLVVLEPAASSALDPRTRAQSQAALAAARTRLAAAREQARAAEAAASQAAREARRLRTLAADQLVAAESAERAETERLRASREAASARFMQATAEHEVAAAEAVLTQGASSRSGDAVLQLTAPVDGVVLRRHYESERPVQVGDPLLEIGDPSALEVEVDVLSADAVRLQPGMVVELLRSGAPEPLAGRVRRIEPGGFTKVSALGVEEQRAWVIVDLTSPHGDSARLGDAYRVNARFLLHAVDDALRVPSSAVFGHGNGHAVFRIESGRARLTPVEVGVRGGAMAEIRRGLEAGDQVVVHPDRELAHGDRVRRR